MRFDVNGWLLLGASLWSADTILGWVQDYQVNKMTHAHDPWYGKLASIFLPSWHTSFKLAKISPTRTPENSWMHTLGKIVCPNLYSAFQLSNLKDNGQRGALKTAFMILFPQVYGACTASVLADRTSAESQGGMQGTRLDLLSQSIPPVEQQFIQPGPPGETLTSPSPVLTTPTAGYNNLYPLPMQSSS